MREKQGTCVLTCWLHSPREGRKGRWKDRRKNCGAEPPGRGELSPTCCAALALPPRKPEPGVACDPQRCRAGRISCVSQCVVPPTPAVTAVGWGYKCIFRKHRSRHVPLCLSISKDFPLPARSSSNSSRRHSRPFFTKLILNPCSQQFLCRLSLSAS